MSCTALLRAFDRQTSRREESSDSSGGNIWHNSDLQSNITYSLLHSCSQVGPPSASIMWEWRVLCSMRGYCHESSGECVATPRLLFHALSSLSLSLPAFSLFLPLFSLSPSFSLFFSPSLYISLSLSQHLDILQNYTMLLIWTDCLS
jgi:hypothetical protein